jgi:probable DNA repair protein
MAAAGHTILAPNVELAAALFAAIERMHQAAGHEVWPTPRVRDFGGWLREQHGLRQFTDTRLPRVLGDIEEREVWREVIDASDAGRDILDTAGAARAARRARRALHEYGIAPQSLAPYASVSDETRAFLEWNRLFETRCRELGCVGTDQLLGAAPPPAEPLTWIESPAWRPAARHWLARHGESLAPPRIASQATRLTAASAAGELSTIAEWALQNLRSTEGFRAWICIPDLTQRRPQVQDAFDAALAPRRFMLGDTDAVAGGGVGGAQSATYAIAGGAPLAEFAPVRAALDLLAASIGPLPFERFSLLLRAPELHESASAGAAARLDIWLRSEGPHEAPLAAWLALVERVAAAHGMAPPAGLQRLRAALLVLERLRGSHPLSRWVVAWTEAFECAPWALRRGWSSTEYQAAERLRELLASLATADAILGTHSRAAAQRLLRRAAIDTAFQAQTGVPPIWISGQLIDPWLTYHGLWIGGCDAEHWPAPVDPLPLLPLRLQRDAGMVGASAESQLRFAVDLQQRWRGRAADCRFSCAPRGDGSAASPSPLLLDVPPTAGTTPPRPHWRALLADAPELERLIDEAAPPFASGERLRGVATLRAQSRCAFRGFAETRLAAERLERPIPGFNPRERGELIHAALQRFWTVLRDSTALAALTAPAQAELLREAIDAALGEACRRRDPGPRWRAREFARMQAVLGTWLDAERQRAAFVVEELEPDSSTARHASLSFPVRIDRVDRLADGSRVLIDYKTGLCIADWRGERPENPQLAIYALLRPQGLVAVAYGQVNAADCRFVAETERFGLFAPRSPRSTLEGQPNFAALLDVWSSRLATLAEDFAAGRAAVAPTVKACASCHLQALCRVPAALDEPADTHD